MATQITNQATLNYNSGTSALTTTSNIATVTLQGPATVSKASLQQAYQFGDTITYNVWVTNTGAIPLTNVSVVDNLGTNTSTTVPILTVTPLTYVGPAALFINNVFSTTLTGTVSGSGNSVTFTIPTLAVGSTALIQYNATVNQYAGATYGTSKIQNTVSVTSTQFTTPVTATTTVPVANYANVEIVKSMSPDPVIDGSTITYTFELSNYGNLAATNIILSDTFDPAIENTGITVTLNGTNINPANYTYSNDTFQYPSNTAIAGGTNFTINPATFTTNPTTGVTTITPTTSTIVVSGTLSV